MYFKAGDTVRFKSGGPVMTVEAIVDYGEVKGFFIPAEVDAGAMHPNGYIRCQWFDDTNTLQYGTFQPEMLEFDDTMPRSDDAPAGA